MFKKHKRPAAKRLLANFGMENTQFNYRREMNKSNKKSDMHGLFKHKDTTYVKWLKEQLDRNETREKKISYQNDIRQANERVNYQNSVDRMISQVQRDNLPYNSLEQLQRQRNQFKSLRFA